MSNQSSRLNTYSRRCIHAFNQLAFTTRLLLSVSNCQVRKSGTSKGDHPLTAADMLPFLTTFYLCAPLQSNRYLEATSRRPKLLTGQENNDYRAEVYNAVHLFRLSSHALLG